VAAYVEGLQQKRTAFSFNLRLSAIRILFDLLVVEQMVPANPATSVWGPKHRVKKEKTPVRPPEEAHDLLNSIAP